MIRIIIEHVKLFVCSLVFIGACAAVSLPWDDSEAHVPKFKVERSTSWGTVVDARSSPQGSEVIVRLDSGMFFPVHLNWSTPPFVGERVILTRLPTGAELLRSYT